jgi:hypothetical protein
VYGFNVVSFELSPDDASRMIIDFIVEKLENSLTVVIALSEDGKKVISAEVYNGIVKLGSINYIFARFIYTEFPKPHSFLFDVEKVRKLVLISLRTDPRTKDHPYITYQEYPKPFSTYVLGDFHDK